MPPLPHLPQPGQHSDAVPPPVSTSPHLETREQSKYAPSEPYGSAAQAHPATAETGPRDATATPATPATPRATLRTNPRGSSRAPHPRDRQARTPWTAIIATAAATSLIVGGGTAAAFTAMGIGEPPQPAATSQSSDGGSSLAEGSGGDWTAVAATVANSVVAIQVAGSDAGGGSQGSGVVWDDAGHIVTNHHVVENAPEGRVSVLVDNQVFAGTVIGSDAPTDLAVVVLDNPPASLVPIARGDADALRVGDEVAAIGNPLGLSGSVTTGIVSALDRPIAAGSGANQAAAITNAIQTSAALNPGNSGGALMNRAGELVGINSAIATLNGSQSGNIGIGFAIPVDLTNHIVTQLIETGDVAHALLGTTNGDGTATLDGVETLGAQVRTVEPGGPAEQAGIQVGDVIIEADGETISSSRDLVGTVRGFSVGQEVVFKVIRDGTVHEITVTMGQSPNL